ncbi:LysM receptor kinase [Quillaja saponaria]|uniref:LysM receptor kinase n=1 Tax=Quillaja saponaria TaxID=32244 RepID=A0AAD7L7H0_QUISA|nr:LysM receptor kinase [Quillaja saponaria]
MDYLPLITVISMAIFSVIQAQQPYVGTAINNCSSSSTSNSILGYECNGQNRTCQAYLTFRSQTPYNSVSAISALLGSDPSQLSAINSVSGNAIFATNKLVIVPVKCSCSGQYYQINTSYLVRQNDTLLLIASVPFQGLSTCQSIRKQNNIDPSDDIYPGNKLTVPLRCACVTKNQSEVGFRYLLSYTVAVGDFVASVSTRFGADTGRTLEANNLSEEQPTIYPNSTLLVPLQNPPSSSQTIVPPPPPPPPPSTPISPPDKKSNKTWVFVVVGILVGTAFASIIFCLLYRKSKKKKESDSLEAFEKPEAKKLEEEPEEFSEMISTVAQSLKVYKFKELQVATDNFSASCCIKGSVYRGTINGDWAAIKKINGDVSKEINLLNKVNHSNLIRLSGVSFNDGHWYLVFEFAVNGPLSDWIYSNNIDGKFLNWTQRIQIALDVATGLNYLHSFTTPAHVHKDLKSSNILLDSDLRGKIANLGLARSAEGQDGEFSLTRHIVGTRGYMAPEYLENGLVSTKLDVYTFGVLLLEILTGKEVAALYTEENMNLSNVLSSFLSEENGQERLRNFIDPSMQGNYPLGLAVFLVRLIDSCLNKDPSYRPTMDDIVQSLSRTLNTSLTWEMSNNISGYQSFSTGS